METLALYDIAKKQNIEVIQFPMNLNGSMSVMADSGACYIGMDASVQTNAAEERVHLGHELGHCITGSFYNRHSPYDCRQRHENKADKWAIQMLVPVSELDTAITEGCCEVWDLADRFGVTEEFMKKAVCYYLHGNVATELFF